jgi:hypothetical protein
VVHWSDERLTSAPATRSAALAALAATTALATLLAVKVRLAIAAELSARALRLRLLAATIAVGCLRSSAGATLLAATPATAASATALICTSVRISVRTSIRGRYVCGHLSLVRRAGRRCLVQFIFHRVF